MCPLSHICAGFALRLFFSVEIVKGKHNLIAVSAICNLSAVISSPAGQCWKQKGESSYCWKRREQAILVQNLVGWRLRALGNGRCTVLLHDVSNAFPSPKFEVLDKVVECALPPKAAAIRRGAGSRPC